MIKGYEYTCTYVAKKKILQIRAAEKKWKKLLNLYSPSAFPNKMLLFSAVSPPTYKRRWGGINNAILSILRSGLVQMANLEVQVQADQNLQAAQAAAVLNKPLPPPPQNPEGPPANPQNAAAEEVTLEVCSIFCFLS